MRSRELTPSCTAGTAGGVSDGDAGRCCARLRTMEPADEPTAAPAAATEDSPPPPQTPPSATTYVGPEYVGPAGVDSIAALRHGGRKSLCASLGPDTAYQPPPERRADFALVLWDVSTYNSSKARRFIKSMWLFGGSSFANVEVALQQLVQGLQAAGFEAERQDDHSVTPGSPSREASASELLLLLTSTHAKLRRAHYTEQLDAWIVQRGVGEFAPAADDAEQAELEFKEIGDRIRTVLSAADGALSLYGVPGREEDAVAKTIQVFRSKGSPATNNPDDIALLQELSRKDAELHLAYAADLRARGEGARARTQWESGCIRLEAYRRDGVERLQQEAALRAKESALGPGAVLKAESVTTPQAKFTNSDFNARLLGLDPKSPYVTQRPNQNYFWYSTGEAQVERRDPGIQLATVDESLSCDAFRESAWVDANRPEWPPALRTKLAAYAAAEPRVDFVMPPKGSPPSKGELVF